MSFFLKPNTNTLRRAAKIGLGTFIAAQATAIATIIAIDERRKRRNPPSGRFPFTKPSAVSLKNSEFTVYTYGEHLYEAQLAAIESAKERIFCEIFIWKDDVVGRKFKEALIQAAQRGVEVFLIIDTFGNLNQNPKFRRFPDIPNLHTLCFPLFRPGIFTGNPRQKGRDHRKILCVDGNIGFVGGYNIGKLYARHWRDTHLRIVGPEVWELDNAFIDMWNIYRNRKLHPELQDIGARRWNPRVRAVINSPAFNSYPVRAKYLEAIDRASQRIWITMGYFIPDEGLRHGLVQAAKRGVDVRILVPKFSNHIIADWVARPHFAELLNAGVRIFRYQEAMVHAKTMTADGVWSTIGTTNIDRLSMAGNFEINLEIFDQDLAHQMEEIFRLDLTNTTELDAKRWAKRSYAARIGEALLRPLGPLL